MKAGGATVKAGGLVLEAGGMTIASGTFSIPSGTISTAGFSSSSVTTFSAPIDAQGTTLTLDSSTIEGGVTLVGAISFTGNVDHRTGTLTVAGLTSTGAITGTTVDTTGIATFGAAVDIQNQDVTLDGSTVRGGVILDGAISFTGNVDHRTGTLTVAGVTSTGAITGTTVDASGVVTSAGLASSGAVTGTTLDASGIATFGAAVSIAAQTITLAGSTVKGGVTLDGAISFTGNVDHRTGTLTVAGVTSTGIITGTTYDGSGVTVTGTVTAGGAALTSDRRYKKDITSLTSALDSVMKLRGVSYMWRRDEFPNHNFDNYTHYGFIAQEVEEVIPEVVGTDESGMKSIRYLGFTPILLEALKEQQATIARQQQAMDELVADNARIREEMSLLSAHFEEELRRLSERVASMEAL